MCGKVEVREAGGRWEEVCVLGRWVEASGARWSCGWAVFWEGAVGGADAATTASVVAVAITVSVRVVVVARVFGCARS